MIKNAKFLVALLIFLLFIVSTFANRTTSNIKLNDHIYIHSVLLNNENSLEIMDILGMIEKNNNKKIFISEYYFVLQKDYKKELENIKDMYSQENYYWHYIKNRASLATINTEKNTFKNISQDKIVTNTKFFKNDYSKVMKSTSLHTFVHKDKLNIFLLHFNKVLPNIIEVKPNIFIFS